MKKYIVVIATFLWIAFILTNSMQTGVESGEMSDKVTELVIKILGIVKINPNFSQTALFIRKCAHFFEYFVLGLLFFLTYINLFDSFRYLIGYSFLSSLFISVIDEVIQVFVPGRVGAVTDVLIDCSGVILGILLGILIIKFKSKKQELK